MTDIVRDLEYRFDIGGRAYIAQVCSPDEHAAAPVTRSQGNFDVMIVTLAAANLADFHRDDPTVMADRIIDDVSARMPAAPRVAFDAFRDEIVGWIGAHRRAIGGLGN